MAKNKIERIDQEIEKTREKIAEYQEKLKTPGSTENGGRESGNRSDGSCVTHDSSTAERYAFRWNEPRQRYSTVGIK